MDSHILINEQSAATYKDVVIAELPTVSCGFPSPAESELELRLSITDFFTSNAAATFFGKAIGSSLEGIGIFENDILVIDRSIKAKENDIIVMTYEGGFTAKKISKSSGKYYMISENPNYPPVLITDPDNLVVWGVVAKVIKDVRSPLKCGHGRIRKVV
ncbi:MAG: translesion error-prone DNA polymerase V autoproteolytic subunit [Sphingobacteriaceae bacterium]|nr:MAG: translesion error-prone DNA polymerase V autoproteolytic subunit [Sphingobacteriaceae bacterium]